MSADKASKPIACPSTSATSAVLRSSCRSMSSAMKNSPPETVAGWKQTKAPDVAVFFSVISWCSPM